MYINIVDFSSAYCGTNQLLNFYYVLLSVLGVICVKFFPVQDQTDVGQLDHVFACAHCDLDSNHTRNKKPKLPVLVKTNKNKNSRVISNCFVLNITLNLILGKGAKNLIGRKHDV